MGFLVANVILALVELMLLINEIFYSIQGEGNNVGTPAIFVRFAGCNLWSGRAQDKINSKCWFCDTDFNGGEYYNEESLAYKIHSMWNFDSPIFVIFTGGEPTLQLKNEILLNIKNNIKSMGNDVRFCIETNGTTNHRFDDDVWITVSPKSYDFVRRNGNELKILYPLTSINPKNIINISFDHKYIQPVYDINYENNVNSCIDFCLNNPTWKLSMQQHKILGVL